jgi:zinc transporter
MIEMILQASFIIIGNDRLATKCCPVQVIFAAAHFHIIQMESGVDFKKLTTTKSYVFGFILDGRGGGVPLERSKDIETPLWCHLDFLEDDCRENLVELSIPEHAIDSLTRLESRPRTMLHEEGILTILRVINLNPGEAPNDMVSLRIWIEADRVISLRQKKVLSTQDIRVDLENEKGPKNTSEIITGIIERVSDRIADYVDNVESKIEALEDALGSESLVSLRTSVAKLKRETAMVRRFLAPQRESLENLYRLSEKLLVKEDRYYVQELSDRITRYVEDLELVREKAMVLQEELINMMAQQQNDRMYVLSIIAAIFLPISFITGLFGMNVAGLPGINEPSAFVYVAGFMTAMVVTILAIFRLKKWL